MSLSLFPLQIYYHGDPINVTVNINNTTNKIVKKIKLSGERKQEGHVPAPAASQSPCRRWGLCARASAVSPTLLSLVSSQLIRSQMWSSIRWINTRRPCAPRR